MKYFNDDIIIYLTKYINIGEYINLSFCSSNIKKVFDNNKETVLTNVVNNIDNCNLNKNNKNYVLKIIQGNNTFVGTLPEDLCIVKYIEYFFTEKYENI